MKFWLLTQPPNQMRKLAMLEDCFEEEEEEEEEQQQQRASAEVATTNNGQRNQPKLLCRLCSCGQGKGIVRQM
jgi:hypothetical protein